MTTETFWKQFQKVPHEIWKIAHLSRRAIRRPQSSRWRRQRLWEGSVVWQASPVVALGVKNPPANAGDIREVGSVPGLGRSPGEGQGTNPSVLA